MKKADKIVNGSSLKNLENAPATDKYSDTLVQRRGSVLTNTRSLDTSVCAQHFPSLFPSYETAAVDFPSLHLSLVICIRPLEVPHAVENGEKGRVPFPLQETMTSLAAVYFALESLPSSAWGAGSLYTCFQGFLFTFEVCLHASVLLGGSLPLQVMTSGEPQPS